METLCRCFCDELAKTRDHECRILDRFGHDFEGGALHILERTLHDARAGDADMDRGISLRHTVKSAGHEGIIFDRITEFDELRASIGVLVLRELCRFLYDLAHALHRIHIDASLGRTDSDRAADALRRSECLRNGVDELLVRSTHAAIDECGEAAQDVDADSVSCALQCLCDRHIAGSRKPARHQRDRRHRDAAVDDRHTVFSGNVMGDLGEMLCLPADGIVDLVAKGLLIIRYAGKERDPHGNGTHIELVLVKHALRCQNVFYIKHGVSFQMRCIA